MKFVPWHSSSSNGRRHLLWLAPICTLAFLAALEIGKPHIVHANDARHGGTTVQQQPLQTWFTIAEFVAAACLPILILRPALRWARRAENMFRCLIEKAPDALVIVDGAGKIVLANAQTETLFGWSPPELIGRPVEMLMPERLRTGRLAKRIEFSARPNACTLGEAAELAGLRKDGSEFPIELGLIPLQTENGPMISISIRDITGRVRLRASEERFELAVRGSAAGIWDWTIETNNLFMSSRFKELLGYADDEMESSFATWKSHLHPDDVELVTAALNNHLTQRVAYDVEHRIRHRCGEYRWHRSRGQAIWDDSGRAVRMAGSSSDITAKKRAEEDLRESLSTIAATNRSLQEYAKAAEAATLAKNEFLANMSHELRTPLNAIIGFSDGLLERVNRHPLNEHQKDRLAKIKRSGEHLLSLINNVLDISKIEAREHKVIITVFDLQSLVQETIDLADPLLRKKPDVVLQNRCGPSLPLISSDRDKIKQVLINLLSNAIKFTNRGRITVRAEALEGRVRIAVEDTGIGIAGADLPHVFEKFYQVKQIRTSFDGTGLGLSICKAFAELLGGSIEAKSTPERGSAFTLELPLIFRESHFHDHEESVKRARSNIRRSLTNRGPKVLCIEDHPADMLIVNDILAESQCRIVAACDGREGLQAVRDESPDVILLDVMLPGLDGWQVLQQLKQDPELRDIPVILTSSLDDKPRGLNLGADEYFVKPLESASLRRSVDRLANRWKRKIQHVAILDNDAANCELLAEHFSDLGYAVKAFEDGETLLDSLRQEAPDALLIDPALRHGDGLDLFRRLEENPRWRQIPIIVSTAKALARADLTHLSRLQVRAVLGKHSVKLEDWKRLLVRQVQQLEKGAMHDRELCNQA